MSASASSKHSYSVILPVFNEEETIPALYKRLHAVFKEFSEPYELLFINDGSSDGSARILGELHKKDKRVKLINFSRNFGHQMAVTAGLQYASGSIMIILDADLQDPPEVLPQFIAKIKEGYDVVYAIRTKRKESWVKRFAYYAFYRLLARVSNIDIPLDSGDFCVMSRRIVNAINTLPERNRFIRGLRSWVGYQQIGLTYERSERYAGKSKYSLRKLFRLAFDGIVSFSYAPLQILTVTGFLFFIVSIIASLVTIYFKLFTSVYIPRGFPTTIITILFIGGINMLALGIIGEYIGRIYDEVKHRHQFVVESMLGV